jgi:DDE domain
MAPSIASHSQSRPFKASYATRPLFHSPRKTPASVPSWKRRWAELLAQLPVAFSALHWQPVRSTKKMASIALRSSMRGRGHPRGCGLRGGSSGTMRSHNSSGIRQSRRVFSWSACLSEAPIGEHFSLYDTLKIAYWDSPLNNVFGERVMHWMNRYLNNDIEQGHRGIKQRYRPTCGLKTFATASWFCRVFDEIRAFLRPQSHRNQFLTLEQRRHIHREQFARVMGMIAAA